METSSEWVYLSYQDLIVSGYLGAASLLSEIEQTRLKISKNTEPKKKSHLGQFLTPARTAQFIANLFLPTEESSCHLIDPGAGIGSLTSAFLEQWISGKLTFNSVEITAYELDKSLHVELEKILTEYAQKKSISYQIIGGDFIEAAVNRIQFDNSKGYSHAIINPPYKKINNDSHHRHLLREVGIETVNLYSAFVALTLMLMAKNGQIVAIVPRSFCNGPYYKPFRKLILENSAIKHIHLFASRNKAFKDDGVLQENVIIKLERGGHQGDVTVTTSTDDSFSDLDTHSYSFDQIVFSDDAERFIHIPTSPEPSTITSFSMIQYSLEDIGIQVSTGPVVDFRLKEYLCDMPESDTVPLLYPGHLRGQDIEWPRKDIKKPNAIRDNDETRKWLYPNGFYCVVRRFSSKEEKRRIIAGVVRPQTFNDVEMLGFENHLNVFHQGKRELPEALAKGLAIFLNTTMVDEIFRRFNGHTQVNATDLRLLKYPSRDFLISLGQEVRHLSGSQEDIDSMFKDQNNK